MEELNQIKISKKYLMRKNLNGLKRSLKKALKKKSEEVATGIVEKKLRFHFTDVELPPQFLFDIELNAGIYNIKLNKKHPAFLNFLSFFLIKKKILTLMNLLLKKD